MWWPGLGGLSLQPATRILSDLGQVAASRCPRPSDGMSLHLLLGRLTWGPQPGPLRPWYPTHGGLMLNNHTPRTSHPSAN